MGLVDADTLRPSEQVDVDGEVSFRARWRSVAGSPLWVAAPRPPTAALGALGRATTKCASPASNTLARARTAPAPSSSATPTGPASAPVAVRREPRAAHPRPEACPARVAHRRPAACPPKEEPAARRPQEAPGDSLPSEARAAHHPADPEASHLTAPGAPAAWAARPRAVPEARAAHRLPRVPSFRQRTALVRPSRTRR